MKGLLFVIFSMLLATMMLYAILMVSSVHAKDNYKALENYSQGEGKTESIDNGLVPRSSSSNTNQKVSRIDMYSNPPFIFFDNKSGVMSIGVRSFWQEQSLSCSTSFKCISNSSTGWKSDKSFQLSTSNSTNNTWSSIHGQQIDVKPNDRYEILTHMKLNKWVTQSHIVFEGFNETSKRWYEIEQCPSGVNGPLEWQEFSCVITIPENTTKIREVLNAGWSSQPNKEATTWFDSFYVTKLSIVSDPKLTAEAVSSDLEFPTGMAFLSQNDILVLEKNKGTIQRIVNDVKLGEPILDLAVRQNDGLLGIAIDKNMSTGQNSIVQSTYVFLYFTAAEKGDKDQHEETPAHDSLYRYELENNTLVNPKFLLDLPAGFMHNGGKIVIGPDKYIYLGVGQLTNMGVSDPRNRALNNHRDADEPDGRGGILRIDQNGQPIGTHGILGDEEPLNKYYAYGIRNSFGMDFDPLTGKLWDTENGPEFGDEINLVEPGFNSGWEKVQGIWNVAKDYKKRDIAAEEPDNLADFDGRGKYSSPEFTWNRTVGPTDLKFLSTDKLGKQYENDMLVADVNYHRIYHFELNQNRTTLLLQGPLIDKVADSDRELANLIFAEGFDGIITDLEIGADGYLYVVAGKIYRIVPGDQKKEFLPYIDNISKNGFVID
jgi:aldose sugar dehydrogenase